MDDDDVTIFLTTRILYQYADGIEVVSYKDGREAIKEILVNGIHPNTIILLDINMPIYNGWDFLNDFEKHKLDARIYMFSSSIDSRDQEKAKTYACVLGYISKPLNQQKIEFFFDPIAK